MGVGLLMMNETSGELPHQLRRLEDVLPVLLWPPQAGAQFFQWRKLFALDQET